MSPHLRKMAVPALQWAVGLVVLVESLRLALDSQAGRHFAKAGMPLWMRPALAWTEIAAALLFLLPLTTVLGGYLLLVIFFFAALLHILHGEFEVGGLVVYATAVLVSIAHREPRVPEVVHERS